MTSAQIHRQRRSAGLCGRCGDVPIPGGKQCAVCRQRDIDHKTRARALRPAPTQPQIDLGLEILGWALRFKRLRGVTLTRQDIAELCGCRPQNIDRIERIAITKLREAAKKNQLQPS